jgi:hypothetical protein
MTKVYVAIALCTTIFLSSCFKPSKRFEQPRQIVTSDTLTSGNYWGIAIGNSHTDVYSKVQALRLEKGITTISIANNVFNDLAVVKDKLPLYHSIFLDGTTASANGVQLFFENDKVKSIYTNAGQLLNSWPWDMPSSQSVQLESPVSGLYDKLVAIKNLPAYNVYFQRISLYYKNIKTGYDEAMSNHAKWFFTSPVNDKVFLRVNLKFSAGAVVDSIMVDKVETL